MSGQATPVVFSYTGTLVDYTNPIAGKYQITASGAAGGSGNRGQAGGAGAVATGIFVLKEGELLKLVVGGAGGNADVGTAKDGGGGGGATFVYVPSLYAEEIAGGGGGGSGYRVGDRPGFFPYEPDGQRNAQTGTSGAAGIGQSTKFDAIGKAGAGGVDGAGGNGGRDAYAGGGGGATGGEPGGAFVSATPGVGFSKLDDLSPNFKGGTGFNGGGDGGFGGGGGGSGGGGGGGGYGGGGGGANSANPSGATAGFFTGDTSGQGGGGGSFSRGANYSITVGNTGSGAVTITPWTGTEPLVHSGPAFETYDLISAASGASTVVGAQFIGTETGGKIVDTSSADPIIALSGGNSTIIGGGGESAVIGGAGDDVFGFLNGHAGGQQDIYGFTGKDQLAFGGYTGNPIAAEAVGSTGDLLQLSDGTIIDLVGVNHTLFT